jgi:ABC-type bacteriocin/lantibiotic exporter with double-glycine peptidase domain
VIALKPGTKFTADEPQPSTLVMIARHLKGGGSAVLVVMISSILLLLPSVAMPAFTQLFIDMVLVKNLGGWLLPIVIGLLFSVVFTATATTVQQYSMKRLESQVAIAASAQIFWRCLTAPVLFFSRISVGDAVSRLISVPRVANLLSTRLGTNFSNLITALFYLCVLMLYSVELGLISLALTSINVLAVRQVDRKRGEINKKQLQQAAQTYSMAVNGFKAIESLKAMGMECFLFKKQAELSARTIGSQQRVDALSLSLGLVPQILAALNSAIILTLGAMFVISGKLSVGELIAFQMLSIRFSKPIQDLMTSTQEIAELKARLTACDSLIRAPVDPVAAARPPEALTERLSGHIELKNVSFGFSPNDPPVITDLSLTIAPGARVAIAGSSGSGKTTLGKIALGLVRAQKRHRALRWSRRQ